MKNDHIYDAVIVGAGHNGLIAACYLGLAGLRVLMLEKNETVGGATRSTAIFPGVEARVSVYSYLVSLLPHKILTDLGIRFETRRRRIASYTPVARNGGAAGLLISNQSAEVTRASFAAFTGSDREYERFRGLKKKSASSRKKFGRPCCRRCRPNKNCVENSKPKRKGRFGNTWSKNRSAR